MGWSRIQAPDDSVLFEGLHEERFYFVHSYAARTFPAIGGGRFTAPRVTWAEHGGPFVAAVENGPLAATQFHPEKSGDAGAQLLATWVAGLKGH
jgi:glutamine amidotransferase